ncbi:MAG: polyamine aminopropyltransferase [Aliifodinibius sp.]|nr:polyamine aminopropyltransferase [Fodinibius sp.]
MTFEIENVLFSEKSPYQKIVVMETGQFGRILIIDDFVMLTERDEFVYHEMIVHVPLFVHPQPQNILIIGGGDGGTARECLKHPEVEHIDLVDIDEMVTQACLQYIPSVANQILSKKVKCHFQDGVEYVKHVAQKYDIVIVDSTDPVSVGEGLFSKEFYQDCFKLLNDDGILINQSESPSWQPGEVQRIAGKLKSVFPAVRYYQAHIPTYPSGHWIFGFASKKYDPLKNFRKNHYQHLNLSLKYYNADIHHGAFALPTFTRELIDDA